MPALLQCSAIELRHRRATYAAVVVGLAAMPMAGCIGARWQLGFPWIVPLAAFAFAIVAAIVGGRRRPGTISLVDDGMTVRARSGKETLVPRNDVFSGYELPTRRAVMLLLRGGRELIITLSDDGAAERVLEHLGQSVRDRTLSVPLRGELGAFTKGLLAVLFSGFASFAFLGWLLGPHAGGLVFLLGTLATAASTIAVLRRFGWPKVVVGLDGVRITGGLRHRFVPYARIGPIYTHERGLQLALDDGTLVLLETVGQSHDQIEALARRIEQGRAVCGTGPARDLDALGLAGRSIHDWKTELRRIALAPGGFRQHALSREDFERLLVDARAPADQRVGAALALRAMGPEAAAHIRVAADTCANEKLRIALEACAEDTDDDDVLAAALEQR